MSNISIMNNPTAVQICDIAQLSTGIAPEDIGNKNKESFRIDSDYLKNGSGDECYKVFDKSVTMPIDSDNDNYNFYKRNKYKEGSIQTTLNIDDSDIENTIEYKIEENDLLIKDDESVGNNINKKEKKKIEMLKEKEIIHNELDTKNIVNKSKIYERTNSNNVLDKHILNEKLCIEKIEQIFKINEVEVNTHNGDTNEILASQKFENNVTTQNINDKNLKCIDETIPKRNYLNDYESIGEKPLLCSEENENCSNNILKGLEDNSEYDNLDINWNKAQIKTCIRIKPSEFVENEPKNIITQRGSNKILIDYGMKDKEKKKIEFLVDKVFYENSKQSDVWNSICFSIDSIFNFKNATIFAHGHTGTGKTYTMIGPDIMELIKKRKKKYRYTSRRIYPNELLVNTNSLKLSNNYNSNNCWYDRKRSCSQPLFNLPPKGIPLTNRNSSNFKRTFDISYNFFNFRNNPKNNIDYVNENYSGKSEYYKTFSEYRNEYKPNFKFFKDDIQLILNSERKGIIPRACEEIMNRISLIRENSSREFCYSNENYKNGSNVEDENNNNCEDRGDKCKESDTLFPNFKVYASYMQLYNDRIFDLLNSCIESQPYLSTLKSKFSNSTTFVNGLLTVEVNSCEELIELLIDGTSNRACRITKTNEMSTRSHSIFKIELRNVNNSKPEHFKSCNLLLIDLAGNEKYVASNEKLYTTEVCSINRSLSALSLCINELSKGNKNISYRNSILTRLLQDSIGGSNKTIFICTISPYVKNARDTLSSLKLVSKAKKIKFEIKNTNSYIYEEDIKKLKKELYFLKKFVFFQYITNKYENKKRLKRIKDLCFNVSLCEKENDVSVVLNDKSESWVDSKCKSSCIVRENCNSTRESSSNRTNESHAKEMEGEKVNAEGEKKWENKEELKRNDDISYESFSKIKNPTEKEIINRNELNNVDNNTYKGIERIYKDYEVSSFNSLLHQWNMNKSSIKRIRKEFETSENDKKNLWFHQNGNVNKKGIMNFIHAHTVEYEIETDDGICGEEEIGNNSVGDETILLDEYDNMNLEESEKGIFFDKECIQKSEKKGEMKKHEKINVNGHNEKNNEKKLKMNNKNDAKRAILYNLNMSINKNKGVNSVFNGKINEYNTPQKKINKKGKIESQREKKGLKDKKKKYNSYNWNTDSYMCDSKKMSSLLKGSRKYGNLSKLNEPLNLEGEENSSIGLDNNNYEDDNYGNSKSGSCDNGTIASLTESRNSEKCVKNNLCVPKKGKRNKKNSETGDNFINSINHSCNTKFMAQNKSTNFVNNAEINNMVINKMRVYDNLKGKGKYSGKGCNVKNDLVGNNNGMMDVVEIIKNGNFCDSKINIKDDDSFCEKRKSERYRSTSENYNFSNLRNKTIIGKNKGEFSYYIEFDDTKDVNSSGSRDGSVHGSISPCINEGGNLRGENSMQEMGIKQNDLTPYRKLKIGDVKFNYVKKNGNIINNNISSSGDNRNNNLILEIEQSWQSFEKKLEKKLKEKKLQNEMEMESCGRLNNNGNKISALEENKNRLVILKNKYEKILSNSKKQSRNNLKDYSYDLIRGNNAINNTNICIDREKKCKSSNLCNNGENSVIGKEGSNSSLNDIKISNISNDNIKEKFVKNIINNYDKIFIDKGDIKYKEEPIDNNYDHQNTTHSNCIIHYKKNTVNNLNKIELTYNDKMDREEDVGLNNTMSTNVNLSNLLDIVNPKNGKEKTVNKIHNNLNNKNVYSQNMGNSYIYKFEVKKKRNITNDRDGMEKREDIKWSSMDKNIKEYNKGKIKERKKCLINDANQKNMFSISNKVSSGIRNGENISLVVSKNNNIIDSNNCYWIMNNTENVEYLDRDIRTNRYKYGIVNKYVENCYVNSIVHENNSDVKHMCMESKNPVETPQKIHKINFFYQNDSSNKNANFLENEEQNGVIKNYNYMYEHIQEGNKKDECGNSIALFNKNNRNIEQRGNGGYIINKNKMNNVNDINNTSNMNDNICGKYIIRKNIVCSNRLGRLIENSDKSEKKNLSNIDFLSSDIIRSNNIKGKICFENNKGYESKISMYNDMRRRKDEDNVAPLYGCFFSNKNIEDDVADYQKKIKQPVYQDNKRGNAQSMEYKHSDKTQYFSNYGINIVK
ncbi:kinesin-19, putative [Plasmodium berghei]|nr:kinesin-19, putative [Plasmodium berghei]SCO60023.1 kinesin-19, putative [Plasmodium berghei]